MNLDLPEKLYYSIGEIAKAFNVRTSLLRFWEKEFELLKPKKNLKGTRRYSKLDIEKSIKDQFSAPNIKLERS